MKTLADAWEWTGDDVVAHGLPLFHVHGLILGVLGPLRRGGSAWHLERFSPDAAASALAGYAVLSLVLMLLALALSQAALMTAYATTERGRRAGIAASLCAGVSKNRASRRAMVLRPMACSRPLTSCGTSQRYCQPVPSCQPSEKTGFHTEVAPTEVGFAHEPRLVRGRSQCCVGSSRLRHEPARRVNSVMSAAVP